MTSITYKHFCDPRLLPSKDLIFFVRVASASVKQIDSAITWILSILLKQKHNVSVMGSNTWLNMGLMPFHIYAYNGVWLRYMSLPMKWQKQSYCSCLCIRASQMTTLLWVCKSYVTTVYQCTSKNTLRFLTLVKQKFAAILHHLPWNLSSPLAHESSGLRSIVFCCAQKTL